jgi:hypothetical protein
MDNDDLGKRSKLVAEILERIVAGIWSKRAVEI